MVHVHGGARYLEVKEQIPAGKDAFQPVSEGKWMPFEGGGNGGRWLHTRDEWAALKAKGGDSDVCRRY